MENLKEKTLTGLFWSFVDNFTNQAIQFIVGIVLARILSPNDFGLIGMLTFFIAISQSLIDSGFSQALIRKQNCSDADYSTVFYFNFIIGISIYFILFFSSGLISSFFEQPQLFDLIRVLGLVLIINSVTILQRTILTKNINFKLQTRISVIASISSGIISIILAYSGFGVWSLVAKTLSQQFINSFLLWLWNKWIPKWLFSKDSFKEMFQFGFRLMLSGLLDTSFKNIYYLVIGKYFSAAELGYYTRAQLFSNLPSSNITGIIQRVSYPVLSSVQDDSEKLKQGYRKIIKSTMFISFVLMISMAAVAKSMILVLVGEKWLPSVIYLQLLCFVGMIFPLNAINLNILNVKGRSDLFLKLEIIKKTLTIPVIFVGIYLGIIPMIIGLFIFSLIALYLNSYYSAKIVNYTFKEQILDVLPSFVFSIILGICVIVPTYFIDLKPVLMFFLQIFTGVILFFILVRMFRIKEYYEMKQIVVQRILKFVKR